jgi:hypothetical protein
MKVEKVGQARQSKGWGLRRKVSKTDHPHTRRAIVLVSEIFLPLVLVYIISDFILASPGLLDKTDRFRPSLWGITTTTHVEKQMLHIEADARLNRSFSKVLFAGSSSVVNGIDASIIESVWQKNGIPWKPVNYGQTGLMAYELPFLKDYLMTSEVEAIIFLYNTFCFSDVVHPQAASIRFNTFEFIRNAVWRKASPDHFFKGIWSEMLFIVRYRGVIKVLLNRLIRRELVELPHGYDFNPGQPERGRRTRRVEAPVRHWLREAYVTSDTEQDTIGYRGFRRFLDLAEASRTKVVVAPAPVPDFARDNRYRVGVDHNRIDTRVEEIVLSRGLPFLGRHYVRDIEQEDRLFWDRIHLHDSGRQVYCLWLAEVLPDLIRGK